jgi:hypothetical protein
MDESGGEEVAPLDRVRQLRRAAQMCEELTRDERGSALATVVVASNAVVSAAMRFI